MIVRPEELPPPLRAAVAGLPGDAMTAEEALRDWLAAGGERTPAVLLALAEATWETARQVMVDEVLRRGTQALALLDEAGVRGAPVRALRARIRAHIARANEEEARIERALSAPPESIPAAERSRLAFALGERGRHDDAARLYLLAAAAEPDAATHDDLAARATLQLAEAGRWAEAEPRLVELTEGPLGVRLAREWQVSFAWGRRLERARAEPATFVALWARARTALGAEFPIMRPSQVVFLRYALEADLPEVGRTLAGMVEAWPPRARTAAAAEALGEAKARWG